MIEKLYTIESGSLNPYLNMGLEEYLMYHTGREECILYLWQNERTVVIGRNQNAKRRCWKGTAGIWPAVFPEAGPCFMIWEI